MNSINKLISFNSISGKITTIEDVETSMRNNDDYNSGNFEDFVLKKIEAKNIRNNTKKKLLSLYNQITDFGRLKTFNNVNRENIIAFGDYLNKKMSVSSAYYRHRDLRSFIKLAMMEGKIKESPYDNIKITKGNNPIRKFLNSEELRDLEKAEINSPHVEKARDLFVFCSYTGLSYSDMAKFDFTKCYEKEGNYYIEDYRVKTGEPFSVLLLPKAVSILDKYHYKLPIMSNERYNDYLKVVASISGINKNLTTHMASHIEFSYQLKFNTLQKNIA